MSVNNPTWSTAYPAANSVSESFAEEAAAPEQQATAGLRQEESVANTAGSDCFRTPKIRRKRAQKQESKGLNPQVMPNEYFNPEVDPLGAGQGL